MLIELLKVAIVSRSGFLLFSALLKRELQNKIMSRQLNNQRKFTEMSVVRK